MLREPGSKILQIEKLNEKEILDNHEFLQEETLETQQQAIAMQRYNGKKSQVNDMRALKAFENSTRSRRGDKTAKIRLLLYADCVMTKLGRQECEICNQ